MKKKMKIGNSPGQRFLACCHWEFPTDSYSYKFISFKLPFLKTNFVLFLRGNEVKVVSKVAFLVSTRKGAIIMEDFG